MTSPRQDRGPTTTLQEAWTLGVPCPHKQTEKLAAFLWSLVGKKLTLVFLIFFLDGLSLVYENTLGCCVLILYPITLLNQLLVITVFLWNL